MIVQCMYVVVGLIPLNHRCQPTDRCEDPAASCYAGFCLCHATHYELNNRCSTFILRLLAYCLRQGGHLLKLNQTKTIHC